MKGFLFVPLGMRFMGLNPISPYWILLFDLIVGLNCVIIFEVGIDLRVRFESWLVKGPFGLGCTSSLLEGKSVIT